MLSLGKGFGKMNGDFIVSLGGFTVLIDFDFKSDCPKAKEPLINNNKSKKNICLIVLIPT
jgi:hypothetical protein